MHNTAISWLSRTTLVSKYALANVRKLNVLFEKAVKTQCKLLINDRCFRMMTLRRSPNLQCTTVAMNISLKQQNLGHFFGQTLFNYCYDVLRKTTASREIRQILYGRRWNKNKSPVITKRCFPLKIHH